MSKYLVQANTRLKAQKVCVMCGEVKPSSEFSLCRYITNQGKLSYRHESRCKDCNRNRRVERYHADHEHHRRLDNARTRYKREWQNQWRAENRELHLVAHLDANNKRRRLGLPDRELIHRVLEAARVGDKYIDAYDGVLIDKPNIDHVVPLCAGGKSVYENLCVTSRKNNESKNRMPLIVWMARRTREGDPKLV